MAAARWLLPPPGGPNRIRLAPLSSQPSPAARAMTWALEIIGTASKSKLSRVLPRRQAGFGEMTLDAPAIAFGDLVFGEGGEEAGGGPSLLVGRAARSGQTSLMAGRRSSLRRRRQRAAASIGAAFAHAASPATG